VKEFELFNNNITLLERDSFVSLTELNLLSVWRCRLRAIEVGAFNGLKKLTQLTVYGNEISEILPGTFGNLSNLEHLSLSRNKLQHLDRGVFSGLDNLNFVKLVGNKLQYVHPETFSGLPNVIHISLRYNPSLQIPTGSNFISSHSLEKLDISRCNVSSLSAKTFANVSGLKRLHLEDNNLTTVNINMLKALPKLFTLILYGNPLQCDCQLQEVWRWCEARNIQTGDVGSVPECDTPSGVRGMWWGVLERGECLQGTIQYCGDFRNTSHSNNDTTDWNSYSGETDFLTQYQLPMYAVPFMLGTTCNVMLIIIITCNKDMRNVPNMYILNLAISDIVYLTLLFSESLTNRILGKWLYGKFLCIFLPFCRRLSVGLSAYSVAVLSIQRYRVTANPLHVHVSSPPTWRSTVATICGVWIVAALFAVPTAISNAACEDLVSQRNTTYYKSVVIFELLVSCVLPLCVIGFTYIMTARHLVQSSLISEGTNNFQLNTRRITARIVVGLPFVFLISSVPYHVLMSYIVCTETLLSNFSSVTDSITSSYKLQLIYLISTCFLIINSCLNPVALFCTSSQFRQHLKRYLTCFCKTNSPPTDMELARRN
jgi:hypothetical protein